MIGEHLKPDSAVQLQLRVPDECFDVCLRVPMTASFRARVKAWCVEADVGAEGRGSHAFHKCAV